MHAHLTLGRFRSHTDDTPRLLDEIRRFRLHAQIKRLVTAALLREKVQEVPLRHEHDVLAAGRQVGEVDDLHRLAAYLRTEALHLAVRQGKELVKQPKLVHQLQRRRMHRVAAEVAQEVGVLLQHRDTHARARQQKSKHHSRRTAADDAALLDDGFGAHIWPSENPQTGT
jgi:hypothetical protein